jgi:hypothetical protein
MWITAKFNLWSAQIFWLLTRADICDPDKITPKSLPLIILVVSGDSGESQVSSVSNLPRRLPVGTKYVVESRGEFVHRFVELPDGARISLRKRKSLRLRMCRAGDSRQIRQTPR